MEDWKRVRNGGKIGFVNCLIQFLFCLTKFSLCLTKFCSLVCLFVCYCCFVKVQWSVVQFCIVRYSSADLEFYLGKRSHQLKERRHLTSKSGMIWHYRAQGGRSWHRTAVAGSGSSHPSAYRPLLGSWPAELRIVCQRHRSAPCALSAWRDPCSVCYESVSGFSQLSVQLSSMLYRYCVTLPVLFVLQAQTLIPLQSTSCGLTPPQKTRRFSVVFSCFSHLSGVICKLRAASFRSASTRNASSSASANASSNRQTQPLVSHFFSPRCSYPAAESSYKFHSTGEVD